MDNLEWIGGVSEGEEAQAWLHAENIYHDAFERATRRGMGFFHADKHAWTQVQETYPQFSS